MMRVTIVFFLFVLLIFSCKNEKRGLNLEHILTSNYNNDYYLLKSSNGQKLVIAIDSLGFIRNILTDSTANYQLISFTNSLIIQSILKIENNKVNGRAYYFDEKSGNLIANYNYTNDVRTGNAVTYFDSTAIVKETMLYNDYGEMYWRETYDIWRNVVKTEGSLE
jgi:hypothetical protein